MNEKWENLKKRLRVKYRVAVINDKTLGEVLHIRLSLLNLLLAFVGFLVITLILFSLLIISTPLRSYLPGYNESLKQRLALETYRVDSLQQEMALHNAYLDMIHDVVAGEMSLDSVTRPDSLAAEKMQLDTTSSPVITAFIEQYESKGRDNMGLLDASHASQPIRTLFRPAHGVVIDVFAPHLGKYGITITTAAGENVTSVLSGTVVYATYIIYEGWTLMVQHDGDYLSVYHGVQKPMKHPGASVQAGETLGLVNDTQLGFELWQHGNAVNPESVIVF